ncbi:MAG: hypothetical protein VX653_05335 [Candidatus Thermoplasmatota archaeon]|nr:hypothetical protein [Candidatus Thermoplasmatota archaeon]
MGLFDFLKRDRHPSDPVDGIKHRWENHSNGLINDKKCASIDSSAAKFSTIGFETWFLGLEQRLGQSLGRRLAHAALEHQEYFLNNLDVKSPSGRSPDSWFENTIDWQTRGLGRYRKLEDRDEVRLLVEHPASAPICSGLLTAAWEKATSSRHRFVWSQNTQDGLIVTLNLDDKELPIPSKQKPIWPISEVSYGDSDLSEETWEDLRVESKGIWSIMNERKMILHRDLMLRFEEFCLPYISKIESGRQDLVWPLEDNQRSLWWTAAADSMRKSQFDSGLHILVSTPEDWVGIARRHLAMNGLGGVQSVEATDSHGGVEIVLSGVFHPALSGGILLACWERAHGRRGKLKCSFNSGAVHIFLSSSVDIAN